MAITANKKFWTEFIDIYHSLPSLWNTKDENYNSRDSRIVAWNKLVEKLQEVEPDANQDSVKRKINTFRSNFNREVRKIRQTQREQGDDVYNPTLWYFEHLSFLLNQEKYNNGSSLDEHYEEKTLMGHSTTTYENLQHTDTSNTFESLHQEGELLNCSSIEYEKPVSNKLNRLSIKQVKIERPILANQEETFIEYTTLADNEDESENDLSSPTKEVNIHSNLPATMDNETNQLVDNENQQESNKLPSRKIIRSSLNKKPKLRFKSHPYFRSHPYNTTTSPISTDEAAIYGQSWACGFRKLSSEQKLYAKKAIDEILILGQLNALKLQTVAMNPSLLEKESVED